jgi:hypothetical protein
MQRSTRSIALTWFVGVVVIALSGPARAALRFIANGDGTVTDTTTGLMWMQGVALAGGQWSSMLQVCEDSTLANHDDWRLPNIKELLSIADLSHSSPALDTTYFMTGADFWNGRYLYEASSTSQAQAAAYFHCIDAARGAVTGCAKNTGFLSGSFTARCVR